MYLDSEFQSHQPPIQTFRSHSLKAVYLCIDVDRLVRAISARCAKPLAAAMAMEQVTSLVEPGNQLDLPVEKHTIN